MLLRSIDYMQTVLLGAVRKQRLIIDDNLKAITADISFFSMNGTLNTGIDRDPFPGSHPCHSGLFFFRELNLIYRLQNTCLGHTSLPAFGGPGTTCGTSEAVGQPQWATRTSSGDTWSISGAQPRDAAECREPRPSQVWLCPCCRAHATLLQTHEKFPFAAYALPNGSLLCNGCVVTQSRGSTE